MNIYITRHGESLGNVGEQGLDTSLTQNGLRQAELLGERMKGIPLDAVISSPLIRAVQTAEKTATLQGLEVELLSGLAEVGTEQLYNIECDAVKRSRAVAAYIKEKYAECENILVVSHGTYNNYLILALCGMEFIEGFNFSQDNTGLTLIRFITDNDGTRRTKIGFSNEQSHLK